ncbi:urate oxidase [Rubripirellula amarantea]|uniref:Uricase n=1 Tax=Rubripirellula amarantea TaxID=2527999 RepID=A0A5C5WS32_9BACT|nr:urate oxidase [Rubripirellula amarantea]MDA8744435.1 urate oxidase [Rubripirellula amarantea]TWT53338.1 Uricase [Rubripirellula amarantea]
MSVILTNQSYGKSQVCLSYVTRRDGIHDFIQITVDVALEGDFHAAYLEGDNSNVVPTDTVKNTVYAIARIHGVESIESFAQHLAKHFCKTYPQVDSTTVSISQTLWTRVCRDGASHDHAFVGGSNERNTCRVVATNDSLLMHSGLLGLQVLKTTESGFVGFSKDQYTTLAETTDRIFATTITADWPCGDPTLDWTQIRDTVRGCLLDIFSNRYSPSVQKTLHEMAEAVLEECPQIDEIALKMPNQHHIPADIAKLGLENNNDIFVPSPEPFGVISATIRRVA